MISKDFQYPQIDIKETGRLLRILSVRKGIAVKEIQKALGLASNQAIYDWFNGKSLPTLNNFFALSCLFHTSMEEMLVTDGWYVEIPEVLIENGAALKEYVQRMRRYWRLTEEKCA